MEAANKQDILHVGLMSHQYSYLLSPIEAGHPALLEKVLDTNKQLPIEKRAARVVLERYRLPTSTVSLLSAEPSDTFHHRGYLLAACYDDDFEERGLRAYSPREAEAYFRQGYGPERTMGRQILKYLHG